MKISELIKELQDLQNKYGDLECRTFNEATYDYIDTEEYDYTSYFEVATPEYYTFEDEAADQKVEFIRLS